MEYIWVSQYFFGSTIYFDIAVEQALDTGVYTVCLSLYSSDAFDVLQVKYCQLSDSLFRAVGCHVCLFFCKYQQITHQFTSMDALGVFEVYYFDFVC